MKWASIPLLMAIASFSNANELCSYGQNPPKLSPQKTAQLIGKPEIAHVGSSNRERFHFADGSTLIAQWEECQIGIEMLYLSPAPLSDMQRIETSLWLAGLTRDYSEIYNDIAEALKKQSAPTGFVAFDEDSGARMEFKVTKIVDAEFGPAFMYDTAISYRWFGPEGM
ncbi:hypothetical protein GCM10007414_33000 [Agarivorans gilvus]|uniref:Chalcone isomerase domain-containing protein n=2 Tax=Agarivorans gilvus TaxID=680279 RepID=A0ABQ1I515_9ALTE|nr:hypothetical protein GCM10007414_33000 [Agarivorans gilvus]